MTGKATEKRRIGERKFGKRGTYLKFNHSVYPRSVGGRMIIPRTSIRTKIRRYIELRNSFF